MEAAPITRGDEFIHRFCTSSEVPCWRPNLEHLREYIRPNATGVGMSTSRSTTIIAEDMVVRGDIKNGGLVEVRGYVEGSVAAERLLVHQSGRVYGTVRADNADVNGRLINIGKSGAVAGDVRYGQLALAAGGDLDANVRNVPPEISGDLNLTVRRGQTVRVTTIDLSAVDPDSSASSLTFAIANAKGGHVARTTAPKTAVTSFTQVDLEGGTVLFAHDGSAGSSASFDVTVTDQAGATSGTAKAVSVTVFDKAD
jgi:cytoskeletal protein CcmA (bactofilin family)